MANLFEKLRRIRRREARRPDSEDRVPRRRDPPFATLPGGTSFKEIENAPPGRAEELAGHEIERIEG